MSELVNILKREGKQLFYSEKLGRYSPGKIAGHLGLGYVLGCLPANDQEKYAKPFKLDAVALTKYHCLVQIVDGAIMMGGLAKVVIPIVEKIIPQVQSLENLALLYGAFYFAMGSVRYAIALATKKPVISPVAFTKLAANYILKKTGKQDKMIAAAEKKRNGLEEKAHGYRRLYFKTRIFFRELDEEVYENINTLYLGKEYIKWRIEENLKEIRDVFTEKPFI